MRCVGAAAAGAAVGVGAYGAWVEPRSLDVRRVRAPTRPPTVSAELLPLRVALVTDLHFGRFTAFHRRVATELARADPHLVALGGDSVHEPGGLDALDTFLALLPRGTPLVGVMGNWEYWGEVPPGDLGSVLETHGGRLLVNEATELEVAGRRLVVTGVDDSVAGSPDPNLARRTPDDGAGHLILAHCPVFRDELSADRGAQAPPGTGAAQGPPVILAGHTHGGQIALPGRPFTPPGSGRYAEGWYTDAGAPPMYVSRGLGTSVIPFRVGCRPELPVVEL